MSDSSKKEAASEAALRAKCISDLRKKLTDLREKRAAVDAKKSAAEEKRKSVAKAPLLHLLA